MIVLFLTGVVAMIMLRTLHKDISSYNEMQTLEEAQEESGWKLVHGDVFRPPAFSPMLLSVLAGRILSSVPRSLAVLSVFVANCYLQFRIWFTNIGNGFVYNDLCPIRTNLTI